MRIAVVSTQNNGKTTLVDAFKHFWPKYITPEQTYRELIKTQKLNINQTGTLASQKIIRNSLIDQAQQNVDIRYRIDDRCVLDNIAYTLWLADKGRIDDSTFIAESIIMCRETLKLYDIIFWLPLNDNIKMEDGKSDRDMDEKFREEIDSIFQAVYDGYLEQDGILFDKEDQPPMIILTGDLDEKIATLKEYIDDEGDLIVTEQSVLAGLEELYDQAQLLKEVSQKN
jgi:hypothetical protein